MKNSIPWINLYELCLLEQEIDTYNSDLLKRSENTNFIPRFYRYPDCFRAIIFRYKLISSMILAPIIVIYHFLMIFSYGFKKSKSIKKRIYRNDGNVFIEWSTKTNLERVDNIDMPDVYVVPIDSKLIFKKQHLHENQIDMISMLSYIDIVIGYIRSVACYFLLVRNCGIKNFNYLIYVYQIQISAIALGRLSGKKLIISNHYDRWIYLADRILTYEQFSGFICVSHGDPVGRNQDGVCEIFKPTFKLNKHWVVYIENGYLDRAFSVLQRKKPEFKMLIDLYEVVKDFEADKIDVLILGNIRLHKILEKLYVALIKKNSNMIVRYRPHPLEKVVPHVFAKLLDKSNGNTLTDTKYLVTYGSSLDAPYTRLAAEQLFHLKDNGENIASIIDSIVIGK